MTQTFIAALKDSDCIGLLVLDFPRIDRCDPQMWVDVIPSLIEAKNKTGCQIGVVGSISDTLPEKIAKELLEKGIIPFGGIESALDSIAKFATYSKIKSENILPPIIPLNAKVLTEAIAKKMLGEFDIQLPISQTVANYEDIEDAANKIGDPVVLKGEGSAHKTEAGLVALNLQNQAEILSAAKVMPSNTFLIEKMVGDSLLELLVGIVLDEAHGYVLTIASGGKLTEIFRDKISLLIPANNEEILKSLKKLKMWPLLLGYRGALSPDIDSILKTIQNVQNFVISNHGKISEVEINPLICREVDAIVADALIKIGEKND